MSNFKSIRESKGFSQNQLAKATGLSRWTIIALDQEKHSINKVGFENLINISVVLDVPVSKLVTDEKLIEKLKKVKLF